MIFCYIHSFQNGSIRPTHVHIVWAHDELVLGRRQDADVGLGEEERVSRRHVRIFRQEDRIWLEDLGSTNGTHLEGDLLEPNSPRVWPEGQLCTLAESVRVWVWHVPDRTTTDALRVHTIERLNDMLSAEERAALDLGARARLVEFVTPLAERLFYEEKSPPTSLMISPALSNRETRLDILPDHIEQWLDKDETHIASAEQLIGEVRALEHMRGPERLARVEHIASLLSRRDLRMLDLPCHWAIEHIAQLAQQRWRAEPFVRSRCAKGDPAPSHIPILASVAEIALATRRRICSGKRYERLSYQHKLIAKIPTSRLSAHEREALRPRAGYGQYSSKAPTKLCPLHTSNLSPHPDMLDYSMEAQEAMQEARERGYLIASFEG